MRSPRRREIAAWSAALGILVGTVASLGVRANNETDDRAVLVNLAGRQDGLVNDYVASVLARHVGEQADPDAAADALVNDIEVLLHGGWTDGLQGSSHNQIYVEPPDRELVTAQLTHELALSGDLVAAGDRLLELPPDDAGVSDAITDLRVQASLLSTASRDLTGELTSEAEAAVDRAFWWQSGAIVLVGTTTVAMAFALRRAERRRERSRAESLIEHAPDLTAIVDAQGMVKYVNPEWRDQLGILPSEHLDLKDCLHPEDYPSVTTVFGREGRGSELSAPFEYRIRVGDEWAVVEGTVTDRRSDPIIAGYVVNGHDITARKKMEQELSHLALHDQLTGLANRVLFRDRVEHALIRGTRLSSPIATMFIDLDLFKTVNDSLGHSAGDELLAWVARTIEANIRQEDTAARLGGDEFAVLFEETVSEELIEAIGSRLLRAINTPLDLGDHQIHPSASIGIAMGVCGVSSTEELMRNADTAMYVAKVEGRNSQRMFNPSMHDQVVERDTLLAGLRGAIKHQQLSVHYQPVVDLPTGRIVEVEALLRWTHPDLGNVPPARFIPLAEESGTIIEIGKWVLEQACGQVARWRAGDQPDLGASVNVSPLQLRDDRFVRHVRSILDSTGLPAKALTIEITESAILSDIDAVVARLRHLRELGVRVAIDDFGTGYSSLAQLRDLPVDILKIDRSFVERVADPLGATTSADVGIIELITRLADQLGLAVTAEGIERSGQVDLLEELGAGRGQGFWFGRPASPDQIESLFRSMRSVEART